MGRPKRDMLFDVSDQIFSPVEKDGHFFPSTWRYMLPKQFFALQFPKEKIADCKNCPMVGIGEFLPSCRCCTHLPQIPNFQLGLALKDPRTSSLAARIIEEGYSLPTGVDVTPNHILESTIAHSDGLFGKSESLLCPFMNRKTGDCGMYPYRTVICSTFYCGHDHCEAGSSFWDTVHLLVQQVEITVSQWAMERAGISVKEYMNRKNQLANNVEGLSSGSKKTWSKVARAHLFDTWFHKEESFYIRCAEEVMTNRDDLWQIACDVTILEATEYERAVDKLVSTHCYESTVANTIDSMVPTQGCNADEEESVPVEDLWEDLQYEAFELWKLPEDDTLLVLNPHFEISENLKSDKVSLFFKDKPFVIKRRNDGGDVFDDSMSQVFLSQKEADALRVFQTRISLKEALCCPAIKALSSPKTFITECLRSDIFI